MHQQSLITVPVDEQHLHDIQPVEHQPIHPVRITLLYHGQFLSGLTGHQLLYVRKAGYDTHRLLSTRDMLVQLMKVRSQILQMGIIIELGELVEHQWLIDQLFGYQRRQAKQKKYQQDISAKFYAHDSL
jgi:hypothetical protein